MQPTNEYRASKLREFLKEWNIKRIKNLTLKEYALGGKYSENTLSYWIEEETSDLGGIGGFGGGGAFRFGVYIQKNIRKYKKRTPFISHEGYAWKRDLGNSPREAFNKVKRVILEIISYSKKRQYYKIDNLEKSGLFYTVVWKIAYLYSNEKLNPFFSQSLLKFVSKHLKMKNIDSATISQMQTYISKNRPKGQSLNDFSVEMWQSYNKSRKRIRVPNVDPELYGFEGEKKQKLRKHLSKERDAKFRNAYRKKYSYIVDCPVCKINAKNKYKLTKPNRFLEMHHIEPLKYVDKPRKITESDVSLLCPNCHRAIHRMMSENDEKTISIMDFKKRTK